MFIMSNFPQTVFVALCNYLSGVLFPEGFHLERRTETDRIPYFSLMRPGTRCFMLFMAKLHSCADEEQGFNIIEKED